MKHFIFLLAVILLTFPSFSQANTEIDTTLLRISNQIDRLDDSHSKKINRLEDNLDEIKKQLNHYTIQAGKVFKLEESLKQELKDSKIEKNKFLEFLSDKREINNKLAVLEGDLKNIEKNIGKIDNDVSSSGKIITWVTGIVSIILVVIGAFFSNIFLELYSTNKVLLEKYRVIKENISNTQN